jgi:hypothetical protein
MENPTSFTSDNLSVVRRNPWVMALACLPFLGVPTALVAGILASPAFFAFIFHALVLGVVALSLAYQRNPWPVLEPTPVRADANGVQLGGRHLPRSEIKAGFILPGEPPKVLLRRGFGKLPILLQGDTAPRARDLLRVLGLDVSQTVATFRTLSRALARRRYLVGTLGAFFGAYALFVGDIVGRGPHAAPPVLSVVLFGLTAISFLVVMLVPTRLDVGADGVMLSWFGRKRFIGYGDVEALRRYDKGWGRSRQVGVALTLRSGEKVLVPISGQRWNDARTAIIEERIREAMEAHRQGGGVADAALLRRGARGAGEWVAALRAIGAGANADMRTAPVPRERLFRIVEDPTAPPADRAAAAVAIGGEIDAASRARLRAAAEATAAPRLRIVIEEAASGEDEDALTAALAEVEAGGEERREQAKIA